MSNFYRPEHGAFRLTDPDTAITAGLSVDSTMLESLVLNTLRRKGGMTSHELAEYMDVELVSISPRMRPLVNKGLIEDSGEQRTTKTGRKAIVWRAKEAR